MKELLEVLNLDLSNLHEKTKSKDSYIDYFFTDIPKEYDDLARNLCAKIAKENFYEYPSDNTHTFINADEELSKALGFDKITVCPYKGIELVSWIMSDYIYMPYSGKTLTIDIYDCINLNYEEVYDCIIQELFNFKHDAEIVKDDINLIHEMQVSVK